MQGVWKEDVVLDRLLRRYIWLELILGVAVFVFGILLGGPVLPALGACMIALAARSSVCAEKHHGAVIVLGIASLLMLVGNGVSSFFYMASLSGYSDKTSPLSVLFVLALIVLGQSFLKLPLEERKDLAPLCRGISLLTAFAVVGFIGIVLTYVLSYVLFDAAVAAHLEGETVQDFHYLEGVLSLAMSMTEARAVLRAYLGKEHFIHAQEETNETA